MSEQRVVVIASGGGLPIFQPSDGFAANVSGSTVIAQLASGFNQAYIGGSGIFTVSASGAGMGTASSGGIVLASCGPIISATIRNLSGNGPIMVGGIATGNVPSATVGMELFATETMTLKVTNTNQISIFNETTATSGQVVRIIGTAGYY